MLNICFSEDQEQVTILHSFFQLKRTDSTMIDYFSHQNSLNFSDFLSETKDLV